MVSTPSRNQTESLLGVLKTELARNTNTKTLQDTSVNTINIETLLHMTAVWEQTTLILTSPEDTIHEPKH
jgi:hypothetical protein